MPREKKNRKEWIPYAQGHRIIPHGYSPRGREREREPASSLKDIEYTRSFVKRKKEKKEMRKNGGRDANVFASRRSQRGESVQKVSLRQRQVITYTHEGGIQGGGELPGRDLRLGRHLSE